MGNTDKTSAGKLKVDIYEGQVSPVVIDVTDAPQFSDEEKKTEELLERVSALIDVKYGKNYLEAAKILATLRDNTIGHAPSLKPKNELELTADSVRLDIDEQLEEYAIEDFQYDLQSAIDGGHYREAVEMCYQLHAIELKKARSVETPPQKESREEEESRHLAELRDAFPKTLEGMSVFSDYKDVIANYLKEKADNTDPIDASVITATYQAYIRMLFEKNKIIFQEKGPITAQEVLHGLIEKLGQLGFGLYFNKRARDNKLYLLSHREAVGEIDVPVDMRKLAAEDLIILDSKNFLQSHLNYTWTPRAESYRLGMEVTPILNRTLPVVNITPQKAQELREAA